ncbi:hypothetical protein AB8O38_19490 [Saccharomonospora xinjiangensis]|uniref:hypothetical protein n=1 Tax=Saccharomonospora xinjiangensis TaxID=75294 RepID=UPI0035102BCE
MDDRRWGFEEAEDWGPAACTVEGISTAIADATEVSIEFVTTAILSPQSLTDIISTEQTSIAQKVHDLGDEWARSNIGAMQAKSDWETR